MIEFPDIDEYRYVGCKTHGPTLRYKFKHKTNNNTLIIIMDLMDESKCIGYKLYNTQNMTLEKLFFYPFPHKEVEPLPTEFVLYIKQQIKPN